MSFDISAYNNKKWQREKQFLEYTYRFEVAKAKINASRSETRPEQQNVQEPQKQIIFEKQQRAEIIDQSNQREEQALLLKQQQQLKHQIIEAERNCANNMKHMKQEINSLKENYTKQLEQINQLSEQEKTENENKVKKLLEQIKNAEAKNLEIEQTNKTLKKQFASVQGVYQSCLKQIETEYETKLKEFEVILNGSEEKISEMEKNFNEQEFVNNALLNNKIIQSFLQRSKSIESTKLKKEEYINILNTKTEIISNLMNSSRVKQQEIAKIKELTEKYKHVFQALNSEKKELLEQNSKITNQLMDIKKIFNALIGKSEEVEAAEEGQDDEEINGDQENDQDAKQEEQGGAQQEQKIQT